MGAGRGTRQPQLGQLGHRSGQEHPERLGLVARRFANYATAVLELLGQAELEHVARNNRVGST